MQKVFEGYIPAGPPRDLTRTLDRLEESANFRQSSRI